MSETLTGNANHPPHQLDASGSTLTPEMMAAQYRALGLKEETIEKLICAWFTEEAFKAWKKNERKK